MHKLLLIISLYCFLVVFSERGDTNKFFDTSVIWTAVIVSTIRLELVVNTAHKCGEVKRYSSLSYRFAGLFTPLTLIFASCHPP